VVLLYVNIIMAKILSCTIRALRICSTILLYESVLRICSTNFALRICSTHLLYEFALRIHHQLCATLGAHTLYTFYTKSCQRRLIIGDAPRRRYIGRCKCRFWMADFGFWILDFGPCAGSNPPGGLLLFWAMRRK
jgi:hypothetical protein